MEVGRLERKKKVKDATGQSVDGYVIPVEETTERFSDVKLEDGSVLKIKSSALEVIRMDEQWDDEGHPVYVVKSNTIIVVSESPQHLMRNIQ